MILKHLVCTRCHGSADAGLLFEALYGFATKPIARCFICGGARELHLRLDFGRTVDGKDSVVLGAFLPRTLESWINSKQEHVTFYPFLVITTIGGGDRTVWMPYWHIAVEDFNSVSGPKRVLSYGQSPSYINFRAFTDLVEQKTAWEKSEPVSERHGATV